MSQAEVVAYIFHIMKRVSAQLDNKKNFKRETKELINTNTS